MGAIRLCVMVSGSGTNLQAVIDAIERGSLAADTILVVSNRKAAYGLERARQAGITTLYLSLKYHKDRGLSREVYDLDLAEKIAACQPDLIVLAGWMHILSPQFLDSFPNQVINLHPALPGMFAGTHAIQRAYDAFQAGEITHSGCMVHYVIPEVDAGEVIVQAEVPIYPSDSLADFESRMHETEHKIIVAAIASLIEQNAN